MLQLSNIGLTDSETLKTRSTYFHLTIYIKQKREQNMICRVQFNPFVIV